MEWIGQGKNLMVLLENDALLAALYRVGIIVGHINLSKSSDANASRALMNIQNRDNLERSVRMAVILSSEKSPTGIMTRMRLSTRAAANLWLILSPDMYPNVAQTILWHQRHAYRRELALFAMCPSGALGTADSELRPSTELKVSRESTIELTSINLKAYSVFFIGRRPINREKQSHGKG